ncbi:AraC family transcriptional regulator [uncultured Chitinophaga sp.]|uniref:helix-turn-helix domain-containing protein n=1 Tax=uncultured Chitinophaga sp. TaxID=339340 RepID=UPI0025F6D7D3|nr:AraC family transcriptional regulator [uncultured Chitinophaga sp.]
MPVPKKILSRKDEITTVFLQIMENHFEDVLNGKADDMYHSKNFAELMFIHPVHLTNTIKLTTGKSPCDWMEERTIAEAQKMLVETDMSVADIAFKLTYKEPTNFIKFFRGMCGITPLQYRKKVLQEQNT